MKIPDIFIDNAKKLIDVQYELYKAFNEECAAEAFLECAKRVLEICGKDVKKTRWMGNNTKWYFVKRRNIF